MSLVFKTIDYCFYCFPPPPHPPPPPRTRTVDRNGVNIKEVDRIMLKHQFFTFCAPAALHSRSFFSFIFCDFRSWSTLDIQPLNHNETSEFIKSEWHIQHITLSPELVIIMNAFVFASTLLIFLANSG